MILRVLRTRPDAIVPTTAYPGDAGMDLAVVGRHILEPGEAVDLPTGLRVEIPVGHWARITGRSSTMRRRGLFVNEGIIDNGYRGELFVFVKNMGESMAIVEHGDRLAQLILAPLVNPVVQEVDDLSESIRGDKGFGSSGLNGAPA